MPASVLQSICEGWLTVVKLASYENMARGLLDKYYQYNCIWSSFTSWLFAT